MLVATTSTPDAAAGRAKNVQPLGRASTTWPASQNLSQNHLSCKFTGVDQVLFGGDSMGDLGKICGSGSSARSRFGRCPVATGHRLHRDRRRCVVFDAARSTARLVPYEKLFRFDRPGEQPTPWRTIARRKFCIPPRRLVRPKPQRPLEPRAGIPCFCEVMNQIAANYVLLMRPADPRRRPGAGWPGSPRPGRLGGASRITGMPEADGGGEVFGSDDGQEG